MRAKGWAHPRRNKLAHGHRLRGSSGSVRGMAGRARRSKVTIIMSYHRRSVMKA